MRRFEGREEHGNETVNAKRETHELQLQQGSEGTQAFRKCSQNIKQ